VAYMRKILTVLYTIWAILAGELTIDAVLAERPSRGKIQAFWSDLFGQESHIPSDTLLQPAQRSTSLGVDPITRAELDKALRKLKNGAPGLDRLRKSYLRRLQLDELLLWFNVWLFVGRCPERFRQGVTSLIPKVTAPKSPADYRPITMSSIVLRLFHGILAARLVEGIPVSQEQCGFRPMDGVGTNVLFLRGLLDLRREQLKPVYVFFCQVRKVFDSVLHPYLLAAVRRAGVPLHTWSICATSMTRIQRC